VLHRVLVKKLIHAILKLKEFLHEYEQHEEKYIDIVNQRLNEYINNDEILKEAFFGNDSAWYKKMDLFIIPILKLDYSARNMDSNENICRYLRLDTINY
jgi:hypothetical protein